MTSKICCWNSITRFCLSIKENRWLRRQRKASLNRRCAASLRRTRNSDQLKLDLNYDCELMKGKGQRSQSRCCFNSPSINDSNPWRFRKFYLSRLIAFECPTANKSIRCSIYRLRKALRFGIIYQHASPCLETPKTWLHNEPRIKDREND